VVGLLFRSTLNDPGLRLELHYIPFSHYNNFKARWALRLIGLPFTEVNYLPLGHFLGMSVLQGLYMARVMLMTILVLLPASLSV
jgi:hypothetical protein